MSEIGERAVQVPEINPNQLRFSAKELGERILYSESKLKGVVLDEVIRTEKIIGENPNSYLRDTNGQGLSEEEVAKQLSEKSGEKIYAYSIFMLRKIHHLSVIPNVSKSSSTLSRNSMLILEAIDKHLIDIERLDEVQQILFYTQCFGSRMSYERLAEDIEVPKERLMRISRGMVKRVKARQGS